VALLATPRAATQEAGRACIGMTTFGSTTEGAMIAYESLVGDYDVLSFHARGIGGEALEAFVREGRIQAVLDLTTTEVADELVAASAARGRTGFRPPPRPACRRLYYRGPSTW